MNYLNHYEAAVILDGILKKDEEFFEAKKLQSAATFCAQCGNNTFTGKYPSWHVKSRILCSNCGEEYKNFLKQIGAWDE